MRQIQIVLTLVTLVFVTARAEDASLNGTTDLRVVPSQVQPLADTETKAEVPVQPTDREHGKLATQNETKRSLTLKSAEEQLLANNLAGVISKYGIDVARAQQLAATYHQNPNLSISGEQFDLKHPGRGLVEDSKSPAQRTYGLQLEQTIQLGGKRKLRTLVGNDQVSAAEFQWKDTLRSQFFQLRQTFSNALLYKSNIAVLEENLDSIHQTEELIRKNVVHGNTSEADLIKLQASTIQFERDLATARLNYDQSRQDIYNLIIGNTDLKSPPIPEGEWVTPPNKLQLDDLLNQVEQRPDILAAQKTLESARTGILLAHSLKTPDVTVHGDFQRVGSDNTAGVGLSIPLPIFNNHKADLDQAEAQVRIAEAQLKQTRQQAHTDVLKAYQQYESSVRLLDLYTNGSVAKAREALGISEKLFQQGQTKLLDVLDARRTYNQTLLDFNQAKHDLTLSWYQVLLAAGEEIKLKTP